VGAYPVLRLDAAQWQALSAQRETVDDGRL
jgi:hypothetical protein